MPEKIFVDGNADFWTNPDELTTGGATHSYSGDQSNVPCQSTDLFEYGSKGQSSVWDKMDVPQLEASIRDELVTVFFQNVHPLCPIIDEQNFYHHYFAFGVDNFMDKFPSILFNSMMFAALAVSLLSLNYFRCTKCMTACKGRPTSTCGVQVCM